MNRTIPTLAIGALTAFAAGCASPRAFAPPPQSSETPAAPVSSASVTSGKAAVPATPAPPTGPVNVSEEILKACNIHLANVDDAPKFDFDESAVRVDAKDVLNQVATCVTTGPLKGRSLALIGRADPRGEEEYNFALGNARAGSVRTYLVQEGVDPGAVTITSRGELDATGTDEAGWQVDRRVDVTLQ